MEMIMMVIEVIVMVMRNNKARQFKPVWMIKTNWETNTLD